MANRAAGTFDNDRMPPSAWPEALRETGLEVFSIMVGIKLAAPKSDHLTVEANVTGVVGIAGAVRALCSVSCSANAATRITMQMLGMPAEQAAIQKADAIGELTNTVAGHFKAKIGYGDKCVLTVPTIISGGQYRIRSLASDQRMDAVLLYEDEPVLFTLEIRK